MILKTKTDRRIHFIKSIPLFSHLSRNIAQKFTSMFRSQKYIRHQYAFKAGDPATHLYIIASGEFEVSISCYRVKKVE